MILYIILVVMLAAVSIPAASAASNFHESSNWNLHNTDDEMPSRFDGWASTEGCFGIVKPVSTVVPVLASQGKGATLVILGEQTPHGYRICSYDHANYFIGSHSYHAEDTSNSASLYDSFSGITGRTGGGSATPYSYNPFEKLGYYLGDHLPHVIRLRTDMLDTNLIFYSSGALVAYPTYLPLDDKMIIRVEGIHEPYVNISWKDTVLFDFDEQKYDGSALVNGTITPMTLADQRPFRGNPQITINMA